VVQAKKYNLTVIIPLFNEEDNIPHLVKKLDECFASVELKIQVIFVDDGSNDQSTQLLLKYKPSYYTKKIIKLSRNFGSHAAVRAGLYNSDGEYTTLLGADLQENPSDILLFYKECLDSGADILILYRKAYVTSFFQRLFSKIYVKLIRTMVSADFPEKNMTNFFVNSKVLNILNQSILANSSLLLQIYFLGFNTIFLPIEYTERKYGKSKWTFSKKLKLVIDSLISFSYIPLRLIATMGIVFFICGAVYLVIIWVNYFIYETVQTGWPTLMSILLMGFGLTNVSLGVISEYLWRMYDNTKNSPVFIIDEIYE